MNRLNHYRSTPQPKTKVCLYFGTFAPIHQGHMALARYALAQMDIDELWFVPSPLSPHKSAQSQLPISIRFSLIQAAIVNEPKMRLCPIEALLPLPHYSVRTLRALEALHPRLELHLLMGADNIIYIRQWYEASRLLQHYPIHIYPRPGYDPTSELSALGTETRYHYYPEAPLSSTSSTQIRHAIEVGAEYRYLLPSDDCADILARHLEESDKLSHTCQ